MTHSDREDAILVWPFDSAPEEFVALSPHGGDEDWLAFVPQKVLDRYGMPDWIEYGGQFGCCDVSQHEVDGGMVCIGAHA